MLDLRLDGGLVVRGGEEPVSESIGIIGETIVATGILDDMPSHRVIDITGSHVLPGVIDTHVHIGHTDPGVEWATESAVAAIGGVTTLLVYYRDQDDYLKTLPEYISHANEQVHVDFGLHLAILHDDHLSRVDEYQRAYDISSFKMYTTYKQGEIAGFRGQDDGFILDAFRRFASARAGTVISVHCENDDIVERGKSRWADPAARALEQWSQMRPPIAEVEAIRRMGLFAREAGCSLYIPHVSSSAGAQAAVAERRLGTKLFVESCAQYLSADYLQEAGNLAKVNPPVRGKTDAEALWRFFAEDEINTIGTDHCAIKRSTKMTKDIRDARLGFPGLGTLLPSLLDGTSKGKARLDQIARAQAQAAKIFSLPRKGQVMPGFDADLAIVDLGTKRAVAWQDLSGTSDFSPFEGIELAGWPVMTLSRGTVVAVDGRIHVDEGHGRYARGLWAQRTAPDAGRR